MSSPTYPSLPQMEAFSSPFFFISTAPSFEVTYASPSIRDVLGFDLKDVVGRKCSDFVTQNNPLNADYERYKPARFSTTATITTLIVVKDVEFRSRVLEQQSYGEADDRGNVVARHAISCDITDRFKVADQFQDRAEELRTSHDELSQREQDVLERVMNGRLNKSIARELSVSERTIEMARARLMRKFGAQTPAQLIRLATEHQILSQLVSLETLTN